MWWTRLKALIVKELLAVLRDPKGRTVLIVPPILQLLVFSYAATLEVTNVDVMVLNRDNGHWSQDLVEEIQGSPTFRSIRFTNSPDEVRAAIDTQTVIAAIEIGPTFSREIEASRPAEVQVILDGRRSNASQIVAGYLSRIVGTLASKRRPGSAWLPAQSPSLRGTGSIRTSPINGSWCRTWSRA